VDPSLKLKFCSIAVRLSGVMTGLDTLLPVIDPCNRSYCVANSYGTSIMVASVKLKLNKNLKYAFNYLPCSGSVRVELRLRLYSILLLSAQLEVSRRNLWLCIIIMIMI